MKQVTKIIDSIGDFIFNDEDIVPKLHTSATKDVVNGRLIVTDRTSKQLYECIPANLTLPVVGDLDALFTWFTDALDTGGSVTVTNFPATQDVDIVAQSVGPLDIDDSTPIDVNIGAVGTLDVNIASQSNPLAVDDSTPIEVNHTTPIPVDDSTPIDVNISSQSNPLNIDDSTPIEVNHTAPIPVDDSTPIDINISSQSGPLGIDDSTPIEVNHTSPIPVDDSTPIEVNHTAPIPVDDSTPIDTVNTADIKVDGTDVDDSNPVPVKTPDGTSLSAIINTNSAIGDPFGRLRISSPHTIFESKLLDGSGIGIWDEYLAGTAGGSKNDALSQYELTVAANNDVAIRQTFQRFNYQAGKGQLGLFTFVMEDVANTTQAVGLIEDAILTHTAPYTPYNGFYLAWDNGGNIWNDGVNFVVSNNGVHNDVVQGNWNIDNFDGTGPSGVTIDFTKAHILVIDYEWLGVGRVRMGFNIDGVTYYGHQFLHANIVSAVYTKTPNLPVRYEIRSFGGAAQLSEICCAISSEGGVEATGSNHVGSSGFMSVPSGAAYGTNPTNYSLMGAIRHQHGKPYSFVRLLQHAVMSAGDAPLTWKIAIVPGDIAINVGGATTPDALSFTALPGSTLEFYQFATTGADTIALATIDPYVVEEGFVSDADKAGGSSLGTTNNLRSIGVSIDGTKQVILSAIVAHGAAETIQSSLKFTEVV